MVATLTYADAARFQTKEQDITHGEDHPILSLSNGWMDAKHVFERVQDPLIASPTYNPDPAPPKETRSNRATRSMKLVEGHKSAKENLPAKPIQRERVAGKPREMPALDPTGGKRRREERARRVHHTLKGSFKAPPNNPFACLEVERGESSDESDSETDYQSCTDSADDFIVGTRTSVESDEESTSATNDRGTSIDGVHAQSPSSPVAYYPYLDAHHDRSTQPDEDHLPPNPPPSPTLTNEDLPLSEYTKLTPSFFRPSNPTPREAKFGPFYVDYESKSPTESSISLEGFQRSSSIELVESGMGNVPRLWKLMGWQDAPTGRA
ncbi:hypothetical protein EYR40_001504 [Pleurotus pulmonarius]|nr:hypothetical protein EYR38_004747 [Pleurotus pulmonarius]KAF4609151.1 hypothetical protein EYR40_001504 [Pleurotus pulmonarius]